MPLGEIVEGFKLTLPDNEHSGEVVEILSRVDDDRVLDDLGPSFFIRFVGGKVGIAPGTALTPWFQF